MTIAALIVLFAGILVTLTAVIGLYRFGDTYTRVKALALVGFPAAILIHAASSFLVPFAQGGMRGLITAFLFFVSGPVLSHVLLLAAHRSGVPRRYAVDDLETNFPARSEPNAGPEDV